MSKIIFSAVIIGLLIAGHLCTDQTDSTASSPISVSSNEPTVSLSSDSTVETSEESKPISSTINDVTNKHASSSVSSSNAKELTTEVLSTTVQDIETTEEPITTTEEPITTTEEPITTTPEPFTTTVAPAPSKHNYYNVTNGDLVCIMFIGEFSFTVTYNIGANKTNETVIGLPDHNDASVDVTGSCKNKESQWIKVSWGNDFPKTSLKLNFESLQNNTKWTMSAITAVIPLNKTIFINATDAGKSLNAVFNMTDLSFTSAYNGSYKCYAEIMDTEGNVTMENQAYQYPVTAAIKAIKIQAFNEIANNDNFGDATQCSEDKIADLVPIGVGCALAALIIFVIIAYVIGRRRRSLAYQSV